MGLHHVVFLIRVTELIQLRYADWNKNINNRKYCAGILPAFHPLMAKNGIPPPHNESGTDIA